MPKTRCTFADSPERTDLFLSNPGKVFALVGPFDGHMDKPELQRAIELICREYNYNPKHPG